MVLCFSCLVWPSATPAVTTTLYIDKYFEVRDHDAPTKYVWNGDTRVARISGSLTTNLRVQRVRLYAGWNLVSTAVTATNFLSQISSSQCKIACYRWVSPTAGWAGVASADTLPAGSILWLNSPANLEVNLLGPYLGPTTMALPPGGAFLPSAVLETWATTNLFCAGSAWIFEAKNGCWRLATGLDRAASASMTELIAPGEAIYVQVGAPVGLSTPDPALRVRYYHEDHLGSTSVFTDSAAQLVEATAHYPFGQPRYGFQPRAQQEPYQFSQKERDAESGLQQFEARFLAGSLGRFASVDPVAAGSAQEVFSLPQSLNSYAYCGNCPLNRIDPHGHFWRELGAYFVGVGRGALALPRALGESVAKGYLAAFGGPKGRQFVINDAIDIKALPRNVSRWVQTASPEQLCGALGQTVGSVAVPAAVGRVVSVLSKTAPATPGKAAGASLAASQAEEVNVGLSMATTRRVLPEYARTVPGEPAPLEPNLAFARTQPAFGPRVGPGAALNARLAQFNAEMSKAIRAQGGNMNMSQFESAYQATVTKTGFDPSKLPY